MSKSLSLSHRFFKRPDNGRQLSQLFGDIWHYSGLPVYAIVKVVNDFCKIWPVIFHYLLFFSSGWGFPDQKFRDRYDNGVVAVSILTGTE
jgi:hypothetical protein